MPSIAQWRRTLIIGAALMLGGNGGVAWAEQTVPSGIAALVVASVPLWMALIDRVIYRKLLSPRALLGLVVGFGGVALLIGAPAHGPVPVVGGLVLVGASFSWAAGSLYSRQAKLPGDMLLTTGMEMFCGGACLCLAAVIAGEPGRLDVGSISAASWAAFLYLIFFGGIVGFSAYLWVIRASPTTLVSTYAYVNPIVAVLLGWGILHEQIGPRIAVAGIIIVAAVALIVATPAKPSIPESGECG
jgi:drug/metabolite transporter (DMT)-like permease